MNHKNPEKYNFIAQVMILFAVDVIFLMMIASIFGEGAKEVSKLYALGSKGLSISTLSQFLLSSVVIIFFKTLFYSDRIIKNMMALWRTILMLFCILSSIIAFIIVFDWFKLNNVEAWIGFIISFVLGFFGSMSFMIIKTRMDSKKYDELLLNYKNEHGGAENEE